MYYPNKKQFTIKLKDDSIKNVIAPNYFKACLILAQQGLKASKLISSTSNF